MIQNHFSATEVTTEITPIEFTLSSDNYLFLATLIKDWKGIPRNEVVLAMSGPEGMTTYGLSAQMARNLASSLTSFTDFLEGN